MTLRTESDMDGKYNHDQIESFLKQLELLGRQERSRHLVICSNVQPGYTNTIADRISHLNYVVSFNPETIAQGQIVEDQVYPSILIVSPKNLSGFSSLFSIPMKYPETPESPLE